MPFKALVATILRATTSGENTSMANNIRLLDLQVVTMKELKEIVEYINNNTQALDNKVNEIGITKVKLPSIERFDGTRSKLKGFLSQIKFKITQENIKITTPMDQVAYIGLFLTKRALKWFKPYLTEIQTNRITITNQEVQYMFLN